MEKNKKIILIWGVLVVLLVLFLFVNHQRLLNWTRWNLNIYPVATTTPVVETNDTPIEQTNQIKLELPEQTLPLSNDPKTLAWAVFSKYLAYNKDQNLEGVKSIVYKVNPVCATAVASDECKNRMDSAYSYGSAFKKEDFVNIWSDSKQTILATDFKIVEDDNFISRTRSIIFFIKDRAGLKLLSFSPGKGAVLTKTSTTREELLGKLNLYTEDNDRDGIADYDEQCLGVPEGQACTKTDPKLRDTNGNGLWDGVEALMN